MIEYLPRSEDDMARDFISEDDLNTFDGYLRLQGIEPSIVGTKSAGDVPPVFR